MPPEQPRIKAEQCSARNSECAAAKPGRYLPQMPHVRLLTTQVSTVLTRPVPQRLYLMLSEWFVALGVFMDDEFLKERARIVRLLAEKADPFIKKRLLDLVEKYEEKIGQPSRASRSLTTQFFGD